MSFLADPDDLVASVFATVLRPPPPPDLNAWAEENIVFGRESPFPGRYSRKTQPMAQRILEVLGPDHPARVVTLMGSAQVFKTTIGQIFVAGSMDLDPCDMLYVHPSHDNALRWARGKWRQMRNQSEALKRVFGGEKSRDGTDNMLYQERRDGRGSLLITGANSPASLSMITVSRQVQDDLAKWEPNAGGDPEWQADSRSASFDQAKILKLSTPLFAKTCRITRAYRAGTQERWHVPCPHCFHEQPLEWENFLPSIDPERPEAAHFTCVACGCAIEHRHKNEIVEWGEWIADNPSARQPSFHVWRAYSRARDWASIAEDWLRAQGDPHAEQTFFNDVLGLPYDRAAEAPPWEEIRDRANASDLERGRVPVGGLLMVAGVDCQGDRVEVHVKAMGEGLRRWTVDYLVIPHHIATVEAQAELDKVLMQTWPDSFGRRRALDMLAIDGNAYTRDVFMWAKKHPWTKVIVVRGAKSDLAPPLALVKNERKADGAVQKTQKRFFNVGVSGLKSALYEHLKRQDPLARGYCAYPKGLGDEFFRQLTAEVRVIQKDRWGVPQAFWRVDHDRNEVLDTENYAEAAAIRCGWYTRLPEEWERLRLELERLEEQPQPDLFDPAAPLAGAIPAHPAAPAPDPAPAPPPSFFRPRESGGWFNRD
ncbi:phage terminase large subunit family protein [Xanthobacter aminoxidans]|uniref:phage terminase large subunit family protein n=1 Tax=Xanthobacter aminoxidans TaxID=186280 RepID=UPI003727261A